VPRGRQSTLIGIEHIQPGQHVPVERLHAHLELAVVPEGDPVPGIEFPLVDLGYVIEHEEDTLSGVFDHRGEGTIPANVLTAESQAPALQPPGPTLRGMRAAGKHLRWIHVAAVGGV
jgi:hypothetical protein